MATTGLKKRLHKNMHLPFDEVPMDHNLSDTNESDSLLFRIRILMLFSPLKTARKQAVTVIQ